MLDKKRGQKITLTPTHVVRVIASPFALALHDFGLGIE